MGQGQGRQHPARSPEWAWVEGRDAPQEKAMPGCKPCSSAGRWGVRPRRPPSRTPLAWCGEAEGAALAHPTRGHSRCLGGSQTLPLACGDPQQKRRLRVQVQTGSQKGVQLKGITTGALRAQLVPSTALGVPGDISHTLLCCHYPTGWRKEPETQGQAAALGSEAAGARPSASCRHSPWPPGDWGLPARLASSPRPDPALVRRASRARAFISRGQETKLSP